MKNIDALEQEYKISNACIFLQSDIIARMGRLYEDRARGQSVWKRVSSFLARLKNLEDNKAKADGRWSVRFSAFCQQIGRAQ